MISLSPIPRRFFPVDHFLWLRAAAAPPATRGTEPSVNPAMAQHISAIGAVFSRLPSGPPIDPAALAAAIGHPPQTFTEFLHEHRHHFVATPDH
ncbi:hypothetical protein ACWDYH_18490 [Nocardia goodfellowii]